MCGAAVRGRIDAAWVVLDGVLDPEVPALSVRDLGLVREVSLADDDGLDVVLTPTYSGCPATEVICADVRNALDAAGLGPARVSLRRAPAWSSDWISSEGRRKLREYGIAPPGPAGEGTVHFIARGVACTRCGSPQTERLSAFGATACKSIYRCLACREPFEHFKAL
ncbi:MAG TPA: 1,2-phenylacetyl-CoA epoxidase subunit PaaD [Rubrivivax sp.]